MSQKSFLNGEVKALANALKTIENKNTHELETTFPEVAKIFRLYETRKDGILKALKAQQTELIMEMAKLLNRIEAAKSKNQTMWVAHLESLLSEQQKQIRAIDEKITRRVFKLLNSY